jgi:hypothetical protein
MEEDLIGFETAKLAKEKGFNEICDYNYDLCLQDIIDEDEGENEIRYKKDSTALHKYKNYNSEFKNGPYWANFSVTTQSLLQKWLRKNHKIEIHIDCITQTNYKDKTVKVGFYQYMVKSSSNYYFITMSNKHFKEYEEALEEALQEALKTLK